MPRREYPKPVDARNNEIKLGDVIVYPVRRRSNIYLREAAVCEIPGEGCLIKKGIVALSPSGRRVIIENPNRCAVVSTFEERNR